MNNFDIPIFKASYDLYKMLHEIRKTIQKQDRFTIFARCENTLLSITNDIMRASQTAKQEKLSVLENASINLNVLRMLMRLLKDIKAVNIKKYLSLETNIDEIGRMLGGWIRSIK